MNKFLKGVLAGSMALSMVACGGSNGSSAPAAEESEVRVAMITDSGDITDQSFNQTTYEAGKAFCEENGLDFTYYKPSEATDDARIAMLDKAYDDGYNVVLLPGYLFAEVVAYGSNEYPDLKMIALDLSEFDISGASQEANMANVYSTVYQEEIPGFMAGYAAVKMGYRELGFLGGVAVPAVIRYGQGFVQGADAAAAELDVDVNVKYVYGGAFQGDADITAVMDTWYKGGTEVVFACGGGIFTSAAEAAAKVNGKVIGVDVDQAPTIDGNYGKGMTITSAEKGLTNTVKNILQAILDGKFSDYAGKVDNLGIDGDYVGLSASTQWCDTFTEEDYAKLVQDIKDGKIAIDNNTDKMPAVKKVKVDDQGSIK
ncbi:MAG: BMP family ABC transporter substrate-binding protein [Firmicutes bacterium]|nr:BMP family ABC transporter substrate-binding protein [Bacillota bacterium]